MLLLKKVLSDRIRYKDIYITVSDYKNRFSHETELKTPP